ncbi:MAG TPA: hypothetical protein VED17_09315 [Nitrososphaerales archaeon]|nr:hypothetical protein [Nitrososphaerales archaeon]
MLEEIRKDTIATFLLQKSNITEVQLDTLLASKEEGNLNFKRTLREKHKVSKGAFSRTLKQAQHNAEAAVYSIFLLSYLNLINQADVNHLIRNTKMLGELKEARPAMEDQMRVLEAMQEYVETLASGRRKLIV